MKVAKMQRQILKILVAYATVVMTFSAFAEQCEHSLLDLAAPIERWEDGIPLGNGGAGALLWGGGDTLNVTLDRADFWHAARSVRGIGFLSKSKIKRSKNGY